MNLRHPKAIRLGGWAAALATLLAVAAGSYLAFTFLTAGDVLNGGIIAGMTVASGLFGGLLSYCLFVFASMRSTSAEAPAVTSSEQPAAKEALSVDETPADEDEAIAISVAGSPLPPPELSDDAIPVFTASKSPTADADSDDFDPNLLVVPPPIDAVGDSDSIAVERSVSADDFDSAMDLPVRIDVPELNVEDMDAVPPVVQSQTNAVVSALTQTDEVDVLDILAESVTPPPPPKPILPEVVADSGKPSLPDAFPDIFKSAFPKAAPAVSETPVAPAPVPQKPVVAKAPPPKVAPAAVAKPQPKPAAPSRPAPQRPQADADDDESLPVVDDLSDIAITLGPVTQTGVLPTEIPDFFLKMPTGRSMPGSKPVMPVAPVTPRQVAPAQPVHHHAAVVRIIDSTTSVEEGDDLVTLTAIPDDWPS